MSEEKPTDIIDTLDSIDTALAEFDKVLQDVDDPFRLADAKISQIDKKHVTESPVVKEVPLPPPSSEKLPIQYIDVVLRDELQSDEQNCRPSENHDGLDLCVLDKTVTKFRYDPDTFEKATGASLEALQEKIDECPLCKIDPSHRDSH